MDLSDLLCLFSARVERRDGSYVFEVPEQEMEFGPVREGETYRVGLYPAAEPSQDDTPPSARAAKSARMETPSGRRGRSEGPPVEEGDARQVEIEDLGEQGDGLARIGPGYVVFVPGTDVGDRVRIRITDARENFAFADVVESS